MATIYDIRTPGSVDPSLGSFGTLYRRSRDRLNQLTEVEDRKRREPDPVMTLQQLLLQYAMQRASQPTSTAGSSSSGYGGGGDYAEGVGQETFPNVKVTQPSVPRGGGEIPVAATKRVEVLSPPGETAYPYREWDKPYYGEPSNLVTRQGITLQRGPMRSLLEIARASNILPGPQEVGEIGGGFRSQAAQRSAAATNPFAATPGYSYHPMGLAIDAGWWSERPRLHQALLAAGWNQFDRGYEPWHYSYGVTG